jgi:hypothetical protein
MKLKNALIILILAAIALCYYYSFKVLFNPRHRVFQRERFLIESKKLSKQVEYGTYELTSKCSCRKNEKIFVKLHHDLTSIYLNEKKLYNLKTDKFLSRRFTCDLYNVLRRGLKQKVYSYSIFSNKERYSQRVKSITYQIKAFYDREWSIRYYYDHTINKNLICQVECLRNESNGEYLDNADFCDMDNLKFTFSDFLLNRTYNASDIWGTMWRYFTIYDSFVDVFSARDSDSDILQREVDSVNFWLDKKDKLGHIMRGKTDINAI